MELKMRNKVGYSLGTLAKDLISPIWGSYLMFFYTDIFGISGTAAGILLFVARIWDAVNDPMMGVIVDKTKTKWGRYRPYILIAPIPLYLFAILTFTVPDRCTIHSNPYRRNVPFRCGHDRTGAGRIWKKSSRSCNFGKCGKSCLSG